MPKRWGLQGWNLPFGRDGNVKERSALFQGRHTHMRCPQDNILSFTTQRQISSLSKSHQVRAQLFAESVGEPWDMRDSGAGRWHRGIYSSLKLVQEKFPSITFKYSELDLDLFHKNLPLQQVKFGTDSIYKGFKRIIVHNSYPKRIFHPNNRKSLHKVSAVVRTNLSNSKLVSCWNSING